MRFLDMTPRLYGDPTELRALIMFAVGEFSADGIDARHVAILGGALDAIERTLREHLRPADAVAVEDPCFPGVLDLLRSSGFKVVPFSVDDEGPIPESVEQAVRRRCHAVVVTPRAQNPTGAAITASRAADLQRVLRPFTNVLVIENDYAAPIAGAPPVTVVNESRAHWAVVRSVSKFLGPDLRLAVTAGDELTIARVRSRQATGARWVSGILQQLALAMWSDPSSARRLARAAEIYAQRREALLAALRTRRIEARGRTGLNVWIPVLEEHRVTHALAERGWAVAPGERFRIASPPAVRVTTATLTPPDADRFADALAGVLGPTTALA
jgi:DNA-binding transcriptional MocR family regulator